MMVVLRNRVDDGLGWCRLGGGFLSRDLQLRVEGEIPGEEHRELIMALHGGLN